jgi:predicted esterase
MRRRSSALSMLLRVAAFAVLVPVVVTYEYVATAQQPAAPADATTPAPGRGRGGRGPQPVDPRVQIRTHHFAETNEEIPYALFVSSKVRKDRKAPMIVTLHGLGGTHTTMMRPNALDLAEAGGYVLLAPMGYNPRGWYGAPAPQGRGRRGAPPTAPAPQAPPPAATGVADPANLRELSEKETLQVIDLVRKEFTIDDARTYLMGHSMGGAGTLYLAITHPQRWAAVSAIAPAAFSVDTPGLSKIPKMPVMLVHGDMDTVVPVSVGRAWVEAMKSLKMNHEYIEVPGGDHGSVITSHQADIYAFFAKHAR